jgi:hypothetical protein
MKASLGKRLWRTGERVLSIACWLFLVLDLLLLIFIFKQETFKWDQFFAGFSILILIFSLVTLVCFFPVWIQLTYFGFFLYLYYKHGYRIVYSLRTGIDYDRPWSLPGAIDNLTGLSIRGKVIDFIFWSGLVFSVMVVALQLQRWILALLAQRQVGFAVEIREEEKRKLIEEKTKYLEAQAKGRVRSKRQK